MGELETAGKGQQGMKKINSYPFLFITNIRCRGGRGWFKGKFFIVILIKILLIYDIDFSAI